MDLEKNQRMQILQKKLFNLKKKSKHLFMQKKVFKELFLRSDKIGAKDFWTNFFLQKNWWMIKETLGFKLLLLIFLTNGGKLCCGSQSFAKKGIKSEI